MVSALWVVQGRRDAEASLSPRPGANVFAFAVAYASLCLSEELAEQRVVQLVAASLATKPFELMSL